MPNIQLPRSKKSAALLIILIGIVIYCSFWQPAPNRVTLQMTQVEPISTGRLLQLYYSYGIPGFKEFTERNSVKEFISHQSEGTHVSFHLPGFSSLRSIRLDFGNVPGLFHISSLTYGYERRGTFYPLTNIDGANLPDKFKNTNGISSSSIDGRELVVAVSDNDPYLVLDVARADWRNSLTYQDLWYLRAQRCGTIIFVVLIIAGGLHLITLLLNKRITFLAGIQCALLVVILSGLYALSWNPSPNTFKLQAMQSEPLTWGKTLRLYYTYDIIGFKTLQEKNSTKQYIHHSNAYLDVTFPIPGFRALNIVRLDFGIGEGLLHIQGLQIGYTSWGRFYELAYLPPDVLNDLLFPNDDVIISFEDDNALRIEHSGEDPHALFTISEIIETLHFSSNQLATIKIHRFTSTLVLLLVVAVLIRVCRSGWVLVAGSQLTPFWNKASPYLFIIGVGAIGFIVYQPYLTFEKLYLFADVANDSVTAFWPLTIHLSEYFHSEGWPLWSFAIGVGQGFYNAFVDPFSFLHGVLPADQVAYGFAIMQYVKIICAALLFFGWLRLCGLGRYASMVVAVCLCFSAHMIVRGNWVHYATEVVMIAFALYSVELYLVKQKWYLLPFAIVFMVMRGIFHSYIWTLVLLFYCVGRLNYIYQGQIKNQVVSLAKFILFYCFGLLLAAYILLPGLFSIFKTARLSGAGPQTESEVYGSLPTLNAPEEWLTSIAGLFSPDLLGRGSIFTGWLNYLDAPHFYVGLISLLLVPQVFCGRSARFRVLISIVLCFCLMYLFLPWFRYILNAFHGYYYKTSSFWVTLSFAGCAALAFDNCISKHVLNLPILIITVVFSLYFLYAIDNNSFVKSYLSLDKNTHLLLVIVTLMIGYLFSLIFLKSTRLRSLGLVLIPVLLIGETIYIAGGSSTDRDNLRADVLTTGGFFYDESKNFIDQIRNDDQDGFYRIEKSEPTVHFNDALAQNYFGLKSYNSFNSSSYIIALESFGIDYHHKSVGTSYITGLNNRFILESLLSVKYYLQMLASDQQISPSYRAIDTGEKYRLLTNELYLPLGFMYDHVISTQDALSFPPKMRDLIALAAAIIDMEEISNIQITPLDDRSLQEIYRLYNTGYFSPEAMQFIRNHIEYLQKHSMTIDYLSPNEIKGSIEVDKMGLLFLSIPVENGWKFMVNGKKSTPITTHFGFYGLVLEPGKHNIEITYFPPFLKTGILISACCLVLFIILLCGERLSPSIHRRLRLPPPDLRYSWEP